MITKDTIAEILGIEEDTISDSVYAWAKAQFFTYIDGVAESTTKTYRRFFNKTTSWIKLPHSNITSIDSITIDGVEQTGLTEFSSYKYNPDSGMFYWSSSFYGGQLVEIEYTLAAYDHLDIHDYLVTLLVIRALSMFNPASLAQVKKLQIGKYKKEFSGMAVDLDEAVKVLNAEIDRIVALIDGDDGSVSVQTIV